MPTIEQQINQLKIDKQNLVSELNNMGVEASNNETFTSLTPKVGKIVTDPILQDKSIEITENGTQTITADNGYNGLNNVVVTTNVASSGGGSGEVITITDAQYLFYSGARLDKLNELLSMCSDLNNTRNMFYNCTSLKNVDFSNVTFKDLKKMNNMFYGCSNLESVDLSNIGAVPVNTLEGMFKNCTSLKSVNLCNFEVTTIENHIITSAFSGCTNLEVIDLSSLRLTAFNFNNDVFYNCGINTSTGLTTVYVKDEACQQWVLDLSAGDGKRPSTWTTDNVIIKV